MLSEMLGTNGSAIPICHCNCSPRACLGQLTKCRLFRCSESLEKIVYSPSKLHESSARYPSQPLLHHFLGLKVYEAMKNAYFNPKFYKGYLGEFVWIHIGLRCFSHIAAAPRFAPLPVHAEGHVHETTTLQSPVTLV